MSHDTTDTTLNPQRLFLTHQLMFGTVTLPGVLIKRINKNTIASPSHFETGKLKCK